jgi:hypothetical protein
MKPKKPHPKAPAKKTARHPTPIASGYRGHKPVESAPAKKSAGTNPLAPLHPVLDLPAVPPKPVVVEMPVAVQPEEELTMPELIEATLQRARRRWTRGMLPGNKLIKTSDTGEVVHITRAEWDRLV